MRVVMYSPDSIGLGHMRRNAMIASEIVRQKPAASVALLIGSGAGAFFSVPRGIDTIKLPSVQKVATEKWESRSLNLSAHETLTVRAGLIRDVVRGFKPDLLVVDHLPRGVGGDLVPALQMIEDLAMPTLTVLGLRDIIDDPDVIRARWSEQGQYEFIDRYFNHILIYGEADTFDSASAYDLNRRVGCDISYVGYVCSGSDSGRQTRGIDVPPSELDGLASWRSGEKIIVVAGGGGHDAFPMLSLAIEALTRMDGRKDFRAVVVGGPLMPDEKRTQLATRVQRLSRTRFLSWTADCMDYMAKADVAVVMAGYNSSLEALSTRANVVMIPRAGPSAEQRMRAGMLARRGLLSCIEPEDASTDLIFAAIQRALESPPREPHAAFLNGAATAAGRLIAICEAPQPKHPVVSGHTEASRYVVF